MIRIGPFVEGEVPPPLEYTFLDSAGDPIDLTGYTATFSLDIRGTRETLDADVTDGANGVVEHVWLAGEITDGPITAEFKVTNGTNTYYSDRITAYAYAAV